MNKVLLGFFCSLFLFGCASKEKLTYPRGDWVMLNPTGYIPDNTTKYVKNEKNEGVYNEVSK